MRCEDAQSQLADAVRGRIASFGCARRPSAPQLGCRCRRVLHPQAVSTARCWARSGAQLRQLRRRADQELVPRRRIPKSVPCFAPCAERTTTRSARHRVLPSLRSGGGHTVFLYARLLRPQTHVPDVELPRRLALNMLDQRSRAPTIGVSADVPSTSLTPVADLARRDAIASLAVALMWLAQTSTVCFSCRSTRISRTPSSVVGCSADAAKMWVQRALKKLGKALGAG